MERPLTQPPLDALGDGAVEVEPVLSWAWCLPYPQGIAACLSVCPPRSGLSEALEGEIGGVGTPWTCRDPQGDPCGLRGLLRAPHHVPAHREKQRAGRQGPSPGWGAGQSPACPPPPALQPCPTASPPAVGQARGGERGSLPVPRPVRAPQKPRPRAPCRGQEGQPGSSAGMLRPAAAMPPGEGGG